MYLASSQQRWISRSCLLGSLCLAGLGLTLAIKNPQFTDTTRQAEIYHSGQSGTVLVQSPSKTAFYLGVALLCGAVGTAFLGALTADPNPKHLVPPAVPDTKALAWVEEAEVHKQLQEQILSLLVQHDWLKSLMKCYSLVIIGGMGSGKSSLASAIVLFRSILFGWDTAIFDPHGDQNLERGTWLTGKLYGTSTLSTMPPEAQITHYATEALKPREKGDDLSVVYDEFSGWADSSHTRLAALPPKLIRSTIQNDRKFNKHSIYLLHGENKGMGGGEALPSGLFGALMKTSAVIIIDAQTDQWGDGVYSGKARFKPPFKPYDDKNFLNIQIPALLNPVTLQAEVGHLLTALGIGLDSNPCSKEWSQEVSELQTFLGNRLDPNNPAFIRSLEQIAKGPTAESVHSSENTASRPTIDWSALGENRDRALSFLSYVFNPSKKITPLDNGAFKVRDLYRCWAQNKGFSKTELFRVFLNHLNHAGIGAYVSKTPLCWKPRILPMDLPDG